MPVTAIPFRSPPAFDLPPHVIDGLRRLPAPAAASEALELLGQLDAADGQLVAFGTGQLAPGPVAAGNPAEHGLLTQTLEQAAGGSFLHQAIERGAPLLFMGEVEPGDANFPPAFTSYLLAGAPKANIGFLYVFPLLDEQGGAHGVLALHRKLGAGPLNHDQPAIAQALASELAQRAKETTHGA
jgi:hypothetical protein